MVPAKVRRVALIACLFLFLFVVIGGGLHLNPGGAFLAAATGTPLVVYFFNRRWLTREYDRDPPPNPMSPGSARRSNEQEAEHCVTSEAALRR